MTRKRRITLTSILCSLAVFAVAVLGVVTYAGFSAKALVEPSIGSKGSNDSIKTIYFNANLWDIDEPIIYMKRYKSGSETNYVSDKMEWIPSSKEIRPTINGVEYHFYVFQYDTSLKVTVNDTKYDLDMFRFVRFNPNGSPLPTSANTDLSSSEWQKAINNTDGRSIWNLSKAISYDSTRLYYVIKDWNQNLSNSCQKNGLTYNTAASEWQWGTGDIDA